MNHLPVPVNGHGEKSEAQRKASRAKLNRAVAELRRMVDSVPESGSLGRWVDHVVDFLGGNRGFAKIFADIMVDPEVAVHHRLGMMKTLVVAMKHEELIHKLSGQRPMEALSTEEIEALVIEHVRQADEDELGETDAESSQ